jgi:hypothetical protein
MLIYDLVDPQELIGFVRNLEFDQFQLNQWLPDNNITDIEYRFRRGRLTDQDAATYRAWDTEAGIAARQGTQRVSGELAPISRKIRLGEEERLRLAALQSGSNAAIVDAIYDDAANMTRAVRARAELARGQALSTGKVTIDEDGFVAEVDFGVPEDNFVTAGTLFSDAANADVVVESQAWMEYYDEVTDGLVPGVGLTSRKVLNNLLRNATFRALAATMAGAPQLITLDTVQSVLAAFGLPPLLPYETRVRVDGVSTRVIPDDVIIYLPPAGENLGETLWGVTAEALEMAGEGYIQLQEASGLIAAVEKTTDPVGTWTLATGISLPVIANPETLMVAKVL